MPSTYLSVSVCYSVSEECLCVSISTLYDAGSKVVNDMMMLGFLQSLQHAYSLSLGLPASATLMEILCLRACCKGKFIQSTLPLILEHGIRFRIFLMKIKAQMKITYSYKKRCNRLMI